MKKNTRERLVKSYEVQRARLLARGYREIRRNSSVRRANALALASAVPFVLLAVIFYLFRWKALFISFRMGEVLLFFGFVFLSIPLHELIHGLVWSIGCKQGLRSIYFGVWRDNLTPYCHCREPLSFRVYLWGDLAPFFLLGLTLFFLAMFFGEPALLLLSVCNLFAAGGDLSMAYQLLSYPDALILDHPAEGGFSAFVKKDLT